MEFCVEVLRGAKFVSTSCEGSNYTEFGAVRTTGVVLHVKVSVCRFAVD